MTFKTSLLRYLIVNNVIWCVHGVCICTCSQKFKYIYYNCDCYQIIAVQLSKTLCATINICKSIDNFYNIQATWLMVILCHYGYLIFNWLWLSAVDINLISSFSGLVGFFFKYCMSLIFNWLWLSAVDINLISSFNGLKGF